MQKHFWLAGLALVLASGAAGASAPAHSEGSETGTVYHGAEYQRLAGRFVRVDPWADQRSVASAAPQSADGWRFVGGEAGWELEQHSYDFVRGRLIHSDRFPHNTPRPPAAPQGAQRHDPTGSGG